MVKPQKKWDMRSKIKIEWLTKSLAMYNAFHSKDKPTEVRGGRIYELMAIKVLQNDFAVSINKAFIKTNNIIKYSLQRQSNHVKADVCVVDPYIIALGKFSSKAKNIAVIHHINESLIGNKIVSKLFYLNLYKNLKKMDAVIVVSEVWKNQLNKLGVENVKIIYNAFNVKDYEFSVQQQNAFKKKYNLSGTKPIVYLGPNSFGKGIRNVLNVINVNKYELLATGKTEVNHESVKTFFFSEEEFPLFLSCCDVVLCMSTMIEGWNRIAHEALLAKTPVIGSGSGGMLELLEKSNQVIVKDITILNDKIEYVINNSNQFVNSGHTYASKFDLNYFKLSWHTLIEEIR